MSKKPPKLKFIYSEKATKFCEISTLLLTGTTYDKSKVEILQNFVAFSEYMNFKLLDKIHKNWPQWASDPPRPAIEAQNRPTNLRGQEAEPRDFALLQKKYLSSSTENPNFRSINLGLTYTFLVVRNITYALPHLL